MISYSLNFTQTQVFQFRLKCFSPRIIPRYIHIKLPIMLTACQVSLIAGCLALAMSSVRGQFFYHQALGLPSAMHSFEPESIYQGYATADAHPSVVKNSQWESELPAELSKSARFYNDPVIAANLAKESLLTKKEMAVVHREAEKIPREQVYKLFKNAGYLSRR